MATKSESLGGLYLDLLFDPFTAQPKSFKTY